MSEYIIKQLNRDQVRAVKYCDGPSVILAGAGSGKTRVLVSKVVYLIDEKKIDPDSIIMITFTNKAANEMKERIARIFHGEKDHRLGFVGTFHALCAQILRRDGPAIGIDHNFSIYDDDDQEMVIKKVIKKLDNKKFTPAFLLSRISAAKSQLIPANRYLELFSDYSAGFIAEVYSEYEKELAKNLALDFDDLIMKAHQLLVKAPLVLKKYQERFNYLLVDEFQDTNYAQYALTRILSAKKRQVTVVGDFSQSIYSWRGADIRNLEKFVEDFPEAKTFHLEINYRSTQTILDFAYGIISKNKTHPVLQLETDNLRGEEVIFFEADNEQDEAIFVANEIKRLSLNQPLKEFAVLYRTNVQSRALEEAFLHFGIPYTLIGGTRFYARKEIKDVLSYLRLIVNPEEKISQERIMKLGKRRWRQFAEFYHNEKETLSQQTTIEIIDKIFQETGYLDLYDVKIEEDYSRLENIKELKSVALRFPHLVEFLQQVALVESEYSEGEKKGKEDGVRLMTLHQAKGLEFEYVFITGVEEGIMPHSRSVFDLFELEEERRLFYVGITRAKKHLYITYAKRRFVFGRRGESTKSRFLEEDEESWMS